MKSIRSCSVFILVCILLSCFAPAQAVPADAAAPEVAAKAAMLIELNSGEVLYQKNIDTIVYPASLTKIMTCLITLENTQLSDTVTVSSTATEGLGEFSSTAGLFAGEVMTVENLLYCMILSSANEACNIAAEHVAGSQNAFVEMMNQRALELGCTNTHFVNAHGLHDDAHYTTARDLSVITREALKNNAFRTIVSAYTYTMPATNLSGPRKLTTTNSLMIPTNGNPYYDKRVTGIKTGFTTPAGRCLIATAQDDTISLLSIVCGCETRILSTGDLEFASFPETLKLLNYGFSNYTYQTVLTTLYPLAEVKVNNSAGVDHVSLAPAEEITALLPANYVPEDIEITASLYMDEVTAPVSAGRELGTVLITYRGQLLATTGLVAITGVEKATILGDLGNSSSSATRLWLVITVAFIVLLALILLIVMLVHLGKGRKLRNKYGDKVR